jgi:aldose 1-epimerase
MEITHFQFGKTRSNHAVEGFRISNQNNYSMKVINWGATLISFEAPDKNGQVEEITLGFEEFPKYEQFSPYFGSTVGRVANRINSGLFSMAGKKFQLEKNQKGIHHLHGGSKGISKVIWEMDSFLEKNQASVICHIVSLDGDEGYPGNMDISVRYTLTETNQLIIDYEAKTDQLCPINLTNHTYWNLSGNKKENVLNHDIELSCNHYLPVDDTLIPTGEIRSVDGTAWDFRQMKKIGKDIESAGGYDHCYVKKREQGECISIAKVVENNSGRTMTVSTTEPGVQFYSGNFLYRLEDQGFGSYDGLCLEAQFFPDAVNHDNFPSILLKPDEIYHQKTFHDFIARH